MVERPYAGAVIAGVGLTDLSRGSGRTVLQLATEACRSAAADAGVDPRTIDGIVTYQYLGDSVPAQAVASALALPELRHSLDSGLAGQAPCALVSHAALVVSAGIADTVVVYRALNGRSGQRVGRARAPGKPAEVRVSVGLTAYAQVIALWAQRFLHDTGQGPADLAAVAVAQRRWAERNERAARRSPLDLDGYFDSPFVAEPLRGVDCTIEVDGAC